MRVKKTRSQYNNSESDEGLINLTPLIDVVLVVLITFILVAPMVNLQKVELASSRNETLDPVDDSREYMKVYVNSDNTIWVKNNQVSEDELKEILVQTKEQTPNMPLQLFQDHRSHFGVYEKVKSIAEEAGFDSMDVVLKPS